MEQRITTRELREAAMNTTQTTEQAKQNAETIKKIAGRVIWVAYSPTENPLPAVVTSVNITSVPNSDFSGLMNLVTVKAHALGYTVRFCDDCITQLGFTYIITDLSRVFMTFGEYRKVSKEDTQWVSESKYDTLAYEYEEEVQRVYENVHKSEKGDLYEKIEKSEKGE